MSQSPLGHLPRGRWAFYMAGVGLEVSWWGGEKEGAGEDLQVPGWQGARKAGDHAL